MCAATAISRECHDGKSFGEGCGSGSRRSSYLRLAVSVSRRTREIGLRTALGANPRQVIVSVLSRAAILMASGAAGGGALLLLIVSVRGSSGDLGEDMAPFVSWLGVTALVMLATGVLAALGPARRALRINPTDALRDA